MQSSQSISTMLGHSSLTRTTNRPLIQKPHNTTPAKWENVHDTIFLTTQALMSECSFPSPEAPFLSWQSALPSIACIRRRSHAKNKSTNAERHPNCVECKPKHIICKQQATSKTEKKTTEAGALGFCPCSTPHDYKPSSVLALRASPNLRSHPFIRSSLHPATRWALFTQQRNPDTGSGHSVSTHRWSTLKLVGLHCIHLSVHTCVF
jgi:hypothetical protein